MYNVSENEKTKKKIDAVLHNEEANSYVHRQCPVPVFPGNRLLCRSVRNRHSTSLISFTCHACASYHIKIFISLSIRKTFINRRRNLKLIFDWGILRRFPTFTLTWSNRGNTWGRFCFHVENRKGR